MGTGENAAQDQILGFFPVGAIAILIRPKALGQEGWYEANEGLFQPEHWPVTPHS